MFRLGAAARASGASLREGAQAHLAENAAGVILPSARWMRRWL
jgi:hypothetical protein